MSGTQRWCPWCGNELAPPPASADYRCPRCAGKVPPEAALSAPTGAPIHAGDPEAKLAPRAPEGGSPLPPGTPNPTPASMIRWAATVAIGALILYLIASFIGAPVLENAPTPTPTSSPSPTTNTDVGHQY